MLNKRRVFRSAELKRPSMLRVWTFFIFVIQYSFVQSKIIGAIARS